MYQLYKPVDYHRGLQPKNLTRVNPALVIPDDRFVRKEHLAEVTADPTV